MKENQPSYEELKNSLIQAEAALTAIRSGEIDAVIGYQCPFVLRTKAAEEALIESERKYKNLVEQSLQAVVILQDFRIIFANPMAAAITGYSVEELLSLSDEALKNLVHPEDRDFVWSCLLDGWENRPAPHRCQCRCIKKDGSVRWLEMLSSRMEYKGQPAVQAVIIDITEHKQTLDQLQESEARWKFALEGAGDGVWDWYMDTDKVFYSARWKSMLGFEEHEIGDSLAEWDKRVHPDDRESVYEEIKKHMAGVTPVYAREYRIQCKDGSYKWVLDRGKVIEWSEDGKPRRFIGTHTDISERKKIEHDMALLQEQFRQAQKMEAIGRLAAGIAHDFNNLLTVIGGNCQLLLLDLAPDDPARINLEEIRSAAETAAGLTQQLLAFSRKQFMEMKVIDLNSSIRKLDKMLARIIGEDIELLTFLEEKLGRVKADPAQIDQAIINIVINARDAMPNGGKLTIETANVELDEEYAAKHVSVKPGSYVMLAISDTGVGMSPKVKERVFEPFFTTKEKGKGTGLGLSTAYGIVKQSGGNIWIYSEPGKGTTVKIYLPRVEQPLDEPKENAATERSSGNETILVIEDERALLKLVVELLSKQGYRVLGTADGAEALRLGKEHNEPIHLILTDVVMPKIDGPILAAQLKTIHPEAKVLYMSGYTDNAVLRHGVLEEGMDFIQKPFTREKLARKVRELLDKAQ